MDDTTLFLVVLHLLVVFTEQLFATLVSSGGNRRLPLAALNNRVPPFGNWWMGWRFTTSFGAEKSRRPFQISRSVCRCVGGGYLVIKVRGKLTRCIRNNKPEVYKLNLLQQKCKYSLTDISLLFKIPIATNITSATVR